MIPYKPEMSDEEKASIDAAALKAEGRDAMIRATEVFRDARRRRLPTEGSVGCIYDVPVWHKDTTQGFWGRFPAAELEDRQYRIYFHVWSDVLQECVLVAMVQGNYKFAQRVSR